MAQYREIGIGGNFQSAWDLTILKIVTPPCVSTDALRASGGLLVW
jgi:hypothetical protein